MELQTCVGLLRSRSSGGSDSILPAASSWTRLCSHVRDACVQGGSRVEVPTPRPGVATQWTEDLHRCGDDGRLQKEGASESDEEGSTLIGSMRHGVYRYPCVRKVGICSSRWRVVSYTQGPECRLHTHTFTGSPFRRGTHAGPVAQS